MLTLTVARALIASCAVGIGGALLLSSLAGGRGLVGAPGHAVPVISPHRGVLSPGATRLGVRSGRPSIQHEPAPSPELVHDGGEREPVSLRDRWIPSGGAWYPTTAVGEAALAMFSNPPPEGAANQVGGCIGDYNAVNCAMQWRPPVDPFVRTVPQPADAAGQADATTRDRRWAAYCQPVVVQDRYGVSRYHYAHAGCEFGAVGN